MNTKKVGKAQVGTHSRFKNDFYYAKVYFVKSSLNLQCRKIPEGIPIHSRKRNFRLAKRFFRPKTFIKVKDGQPFDSWKREVGKFSQYRKKI